MSLMITIKYKHDYYKRLDPIHTTIRGLSFIKKNNLMLEEIVREEYPSLVNISKIIRIYPIIIDSVPLEFLKADAEYEGFTINSPQDFCELINSFIPAHYYQATPDSQKVVIELETLRIE